MTRRNGHAGVLAGVVLVGTIALTGCGSDSEPSPSGSTNTSTSTDGNPSSSTAGAETPTTAAPGTASSAAPSSGEDTASGTAAGAASGAVARGSVAQNKSAKYQVTGVRVQDSLGPGADPPKGRFVLVSISIENTSNDSIIFSSNCEVEVNGARISDDKNMIFVDDSLGFEEIEAGQKVSGSLVFDVDRADAGKGVLVCDAQKGGDEVRLSLT